MRNHSDLPRRSFLASLAAGVAGFFLGSRRAQAKALSAAPPATPALPFATPEADLPANFAARSILLFNGEFEPNQRRCVISTPQHGRFKADQLFIGKNPQDWIVHDITLDGKTILLQSGDLPGECFASHNQVVSVLLYALPLVAGIDSEVGIDVTHIGAEKTYLRAAMVGSKA